MLNIEVIAHQYDTFLVQDPATGQYTTNYLMPYIVIELSKRGHQITITKDIRNAVPKGDVAILHVDATVVPDEYMGYARAFPLCVNGKVGNISKRLVSQAVVAKGEPWDGPVIVKSNYNCCGKSELFLNQVATEAGDAPPFPGFKAMENYTVYESIREVPGDIFDDPYLVVEKFMPEIDPEGYAVRSYIFCGNEERCARYLSKEKIIKGSNFIRKDPAPVPEELRELRKKLGFDYGKFEFVVHDGRPVVIDTNKTLGLPQGTLQNIEEMAGQLANGFESMVSKIR